MTMGGLSLRAQSVPAGTRIPLPTSFKKMTNPIGVFVIAFAVVTGVLLVIPFLMPVIEKTADWYFKYVDAVEKLID